MSIDFDEATHGYSIGGRTVPGVTSVLASLGLIRTVDDPAALERGRHVHEACRFFDENDIDDSSIDPIIRGYIDGWKKFRAEKKVKIRAIEKKLGMKDIGYAGRLDRWGEVNGFPTVIEIKTGEIQKAAGLQLVAYGAAVSKMPVARLAVRLKPDGTYALHTFPASDWFLDWRAFLGSLSLYQWKQR